MRLFELVGAEDVVALHGDVARAQSQTALADLTTGLSEVGEVHDRSVRVKPLDDAATEATVREVSDHPTPREVRLVEDRRIEVTSDGGEAMKDAPSNEPRAMSGGLLHARSAVVTGDELGEVEVGHLPVDHLQRAPAEAGGDDGGTAHRRSIELAVLEAGVAQVGANKDGADGADVLEGGATKVAAFKRCPDERRSIEDGLIEVEATEVLGDEVGTSQVELGGGPGAAESRDGLLATTNHIYVKRVCGIVHGGSFGFLLRSFAKMRIFVKLLV